MKPPAAIAAGGHRRDVSMPAPATLVRPQPPRQRAPDHRAGNDENHRGDAIQRGTCAQSGFTLGLLSVARTRVYWFLPPIFNCTPTDYSAQTREIAFILPQDHSTEGKHHENGPTTAA